MKNIQPLRDNVIGRMIDMIGANRKTTGGLILTENEHSENFVRPRWFEVTHVGPSQEDIKVGQYVLVPHGRWSRGLDLEGTMREDKKLFLIDHNDILGIEEEKPHVNTED